MQRRSIPTTVWALACTMAGISLTPALAFAQDPPRERPSPGKCTANDPPRWSAALQYWYDEANDPRPYSRTRHLPEGNGGPAVSREARYAGDGGALGSR